MPCIFDLGVVHETPRYSRSELGVGQVLQGPVVVEDEWSTVVVPAGATLVTDEQGHLHIETGARS